MHMIYPHRIEHSYENQMMHKKHRETKWNERRHLYIQLTPKRVEEIHSHPCVEKMIPLYYKQDIYKWMLYRNLYDKTHDNVMDYLEL